MLITAGAPQTARPFSAPRTSVPNAAHLDRVELSGASATAFEPAAHLCRAVGEFTNLVATHPSEREELAAAAATLRDVVGEIIYGGHWPDQDELPPLPSPRRPGEPKRNGGLTRSEQLFSDDLIELYRKTAPALRDPEQHQRLASAVHLCQSGLQSRILRRDYPDYWLSSQGTLELDARRERERWGTAS